MTAMRAGSRFLSHSFLAAPWASVGHRSSGMVARPSGTVLDSIQNPVKTVSDTVDEFYKEYPQPPVLPMYRSFLIDFLTSTHIAMVDARFKYDAIFALGLVENYNGLMGSYDRVVAAGESDKIWKAFTQSLGMDAEKVKEDAEAVVNFAKTSPPATILATMEGTEAAADPRIGDAFSGIGKGLYSTPFSIGLFKIMESAGIETSKANVEEWAKALQVPPSKAAGDLETYKLNKKKLSSAEEMLREIEIREKKKLAERLEAKAKALAEKAAKKAEEAKEPVV